VTLFAFRTRRIAQNVFTRDEPVEHVEIGAIDAPSIEAAIAKIVGSSSIGAVRDGITIEIFPVSTRGALTFHAQYDGDPWMKATKTVVEQVSA
jgi:hypothetical protein